jgi:hypothetical protein
MGSVSASTIVIYACMRIILMWRCNLGTRSISLRQVSTGQAQGDVSNIVSI